jgi:hypothetical protein
VIARTRVVAAASLALAMASCGTPQTRTATQQATVIHPATSEQATRAETAACIKVPAVARRSLQSSLRPGHRLGNMAGAWAAGPASGPSDITGQVYFVSAEVRPSPGVATWAFGRRAFRTGTGMIIGVDAAARSVSDLGADIPRERLAEWGLTQSVDGFRASRECL